MAGAHRAQQRHRQPETAQQPTCAQRPAPSDEADDVYAGLACPEAGPFEVLSQRGLNTAVQQCLRALPPAQRESLSLAYYSGMSHSEIAQHVGRPLGTVKSWMRRSLQGTQALLTDQL